MNVRIDKARHDDMILTLRFFCNIDDSSVFKLYCPAEDARVDNIHYMSAYSFHNSLLVVMTTKITKLL